MTTAELKGGKKAGGKKGAKAQAKSVPVDNAAVEKRENMPLEDFVNALLKAVHANKNVKEFADSIGRGVGSVQVRISNINKDLKEAGKTLLPKFNRQPRKGRDIGAIAALIEQANETAKANLEKRVSHAGNRKSA